MISNIAAVHLSASRLISAMYYSDRAGDTKDAAPLTCRRVAAISAGGYYDLLKAAHWATEVCIGGWGWGVLLKGFMGCANILAGSLG